MAAIDIGWGNTNLGSATGAGYTRIDETNPANDTGKITTISCYFGQTGGTFKAGTFSVNSATSYTWRDGADIGAVTAGSTQTFTGLDIDVVLGDVLGHYFASGQSSQAGTGGGGVLWKPGNYFGNTSAQTYTDAYSAGRHSCYGTGETPTALPVFDYYYNNMRP